jgi:hypothetical protein
MGDTIPPGTRLRFRSRRSDARPGDVVVILAGPADLIVHRVVTQGWGPRARGYLLTRGDSSVLCDQPVAADAVLGVVEECLRGDRWHPVAPRPHRRLGVAVTAAVLQAVMVGALSLSPRLATWVAAGAYLLVSRLRSIGSGSRG